ncbi:amidohydrolase [Maledivibacter halophilus]|uniref:Imidazolonepropionase n=1 Tax=Maledivibacter halophilus TaxID=36842 RepID=A0A1T5MPS0_9FIRM|nr:amidohydrolase [Maledivibacter halophilus]SKC90192.1 Imidazolonepropionase [Maledivibacter halophilus]
MLFIKGGKVVTMVGDVFEEGDIIVNNGKIRRVGENLSIPQGTTLIDARGKIVMPGFIDAHTHLGLKEDSIKFEGIDHNEKSDPITPHIRGIDAINPMDRTFNEAYEAGITSVGAGPGSANVIGGQFAAIKTYGHRVDDMIIKEPIAIKCAFGENPKRNYNEKGKSPMTRMAIAALLRETLFKAIEYKKKLIKSKNDNNKAPDFNMKMEALQPIINREISLKVHAHRADDIFTAIRIAKEFNIRITLDHCTEGHLIKEDLKKEGFDVIVGPSLGHRTKFELKNKSFIAPGILSEEGLKVAITTDSPVVPLQYLPICAALAVKKGMDRYEALKAITINAADIMGISDRVGSLEVGKDADIVIWDKDPLDVQASVEYTIINGKIVYSRKEK